MGRKIYTLALALSFSTFAFAQNPYANSPHRIIMFGAPENVEQNETVRLEAAILRHKLSKVPGRTNDSPSGENFNSFHDVFNFYGGFQAIQKNNVQIFIDNDLPAIVRNTNTNELLEIFKEFADTAGTLKLPLKNSLTLDSIRFIVSNATSNLGIAKIENAALRATTDSFLIYKDPRGKTQHIKITRPFQSEVEKSVIVCENNPVTFLPTPRPIIKKPFNSHIDIFYVGSFTETETMLAQSLFYSRVEELERKRQAQTIVTLAKLMKDETEILGHLIGKTYTRMENEPKQVNDAFKQHIRKWKEMGYASETEAEEFLQHTEFTVGGTFTLSFATLSLDGKHSWMNYSLGSTH